MKKFSKILRAVPLAAAFTVCIAAALSYAVSAQDIEGAKSGAWETEVTGLSEGYYDVTAYFDNPSVMEQSFLYASSSSSSQGSSVIPKTTSTNTNENGYTEVKVRGVYVRDGRLKVGVSTENSSLYTVLANVSESSERLFFNGGDISEYTYAKDKGGKYYDFDGEEVNPIDFLAANGMDAVRIRLSNNPGKGRGDGNYYLAEGYQDLADCIELGKAAARNNMTIEFTLNYSDYWSNGTRQIIPQDFADKIKQDLGYDVKSFEFLSSMTESQRAEIQDALTNIISNYTKECMQALKDNGINCDYVSLGNEINGGMLFPFANTYEAYMGSDYELNFDDDITDSDIICPMDLAALGRFLNAGYRAVKDVFPDAQVVVHFAGDKMNNDLSWILDQEDFKKYGETFDVLGISYYPAWSEQTTSVCAAYVDTLTKKYGKNVIIMETGYNYNSEISTGGGGQLKLIDAYKDIYPDTQEGHKGYMAEMINAMRNTDGCIGILYWDPLMIHTETADGLNNSGWAYREKDDKVEGNIVENTTLFDFDGKAIESVKLYNDTKSAVKTDSYEIASLSESSVEIIKNLDENAVLIIAAYDDENTLTGVSFIKLDDMSPSSDKSFEYDINTLKNGKEPKSVKAFIWNIEKNQTSFCISKDFTLNAD